MWLRRAKLKVGDKTDDLVLDFRGALEALEIGSLERNEDRFEPSLGKSVRVYTFFGQETVFADDQDVVIGDLAGLRPSDALSTPEPAPLPTFGGADPSPYALRENRQDTKDARFVPLQRGQDQEYLDARRGIC